MAEHEGTTPFERAVLDKFGDIEGRLDGIDDRLSKIDNRLDSIDELQGYAIFAVISLLEAMKEDEKVRSQMRAKVSEIKASYEAQIGDWLKKKAS